MVGDGGKWVCGLEALKRRRERGQPCIVYSFGVNTDTSFEEELVNRTHCQVGGAVGLVRMVESSSRAVTGLHGRLCWTCLITVEHMLRDVIAWLTCLLLLCLVPGVRVRPDGRQPAQHLQPRDRPTHPVLQAGTTNPPEDGVNSQATSFACARTTRTLLSRLQLLLPDLPLTPPPLWTRAVCHGQALGPADQSPSTDFLIVRNLHSIMKELGHTYIDVLKVGNPVVVAPDPRKLPLNDHIQGPPVGVRFL